MWSAATVLVCALNLLGRSAQTFPPIEFTAVAPPGASPHVEAFVHPESRHIVLVTTSAVFREAQAADRRCGAPMALRKLASIIVHEEWHVRRGADERGAYYAQLTALVMMGSHPGSPLHGAVTRSMLAVAERERRAAQAAARLYAAR